MSITPALPLLLATPLLSWRQVGLELLGFLPYFAIFGAVGFHFFVLPRKGYPADEVRTVSLVADRVAARIGLAGALLILIGFVANGVSNASAKQQRIIDALMQAGSKANVRAVFGLLLIAAFIFAFRRTGGYWAPAALLAVAFALRDIVTGQWTRLVNPLHEVGASLWLGTLLVFVVAGLPAILRSAMPSDRRRAFVATLVTRFSRLALVAAALLGLTGIVTAWLHLKYVAALWTTPYGYALDAKLAVVLIVIAFGAWNWRRVTPKLVAGDATHALRRSSNIELAFAAIVLLLTAVLVSLPSPKLPGT